MMRGAINALMVWMKKIGNMMIIKLKNLKMQKVLNSATKN